MLARLIPRTDTAANWTSANPVLALNEHGWESDTGKFKIGDGATAWASLAYWTAPGSAVLFAQKTADQAFTSTITFADLTDLTLAVAIGGKYVLSGNILYNGSTAGDASIKWAAPAGATMDWNALGIGSSATTGVTAANLRAFTIADQADGGAIGTTATDRLMFRLTGLLTVGSTAGNLVLQGAQRVSDVTATTFLAGSWIKLDKVN